MLSQGPAEVGALGIGEFAGLALFAMAIGIMVWPMLHRLRTARRQRVEQLGIAMGRGSDQRK